MKTSRIVTLAGAGAALLALLSVVPAQAASAPDVVKLAAYRIPDALLSLNTGQGSIGYGYPPAYGFDTADRNIQCYIAPSEDSSPFACAVQTHAWKTSGTNCKTGKYVGVEGFAGAAYGGGKPATTCAKYPIVPRERKPGSTATFGKQVNKVLPAGATIKYLGVACTASGTKRSSAISCVEIKTKHGFRVSRLKLSTY